MSKSTTARVTLFTIVPLYVWVRALNRASGLGDILRFAFAGVVSAIALCWIWESFASVPFTRRTAVKSAVAGLVLFTPLIYMMLTGYTDKTGSAFILSITAAAGAAMTGAVWHVVRLVRKSLADRKNVAPKVAFSLKESHR